MNLLWGLTGSVATILLPKIKELCAKKGWTVKFVATKKAEFFVNSEVITDECEWTWKRGDEEILHISLTKWADAFIIAPCSANSLAKIANGICDNLLTCCIRAWDLNKSIFLAPAMNCKMYEHPITSEHLNKVKAWGMNIIPPISKRLYCGDVGIGALANLDEIIKTIEK